MWWYTLIFLACGRKTGESKIQDHLRFHSEFQGQPNLHEIFFQKTTRKKNQAPDYFLKTIAGNQLVVASLPSDDLAGDPAWYPSMNHSPFTTRTAPGFLHWGPLEHISWKTPGFPALRSHIPLWPEVQSSGSWAQMAGTEWVFYSQQSAAHDLFPCQWPCLSFAREMSIMQEKQPRIHKGVSFLGLIPW